MQQQTTTVPDNVDENLNFVNDGAVRYYANRKVLHRTDGPAVEFPNGDKYWYKDGEVHRSDGPAMEQANGSKLWYNEGKLHRLDGPAIEYADGTKYWYIGGQGYSKEEFDAFLAFVEESKSLTPQ